MPEEYTPPEGPRFKPEDAQRHTKRANTQEKKETWARLANSIFESSGGDISKAIRYASRTLKEQEEYASD